VCVKKRERERNSVSKNEREREGERNRVSKSEREIEREGGRVGEIVKVRQNGEKKCVYVIKREE
jgi:hypothetical protein